MPIFAQHEHLHVPIRCQAPEASQFDFWLGNWDLVWNDSLRGKNTVLKELGGCTITENFVDFEGGLQGKSWSVYNEKTQKWQQTWIDNKGAYMLFEGGFTDGAMQLQHEQINPLGEKILFKMIFFNISTDAFDWEWLRSKDKGITWESQWKIHYQRQLIAAKAEHLSIEYLKQNLAKGKKYYLVLLKNGKNRKQNEKESAEIQHKHLQHLFWLHQQGKLNIMGPTNAPKSKWRGIAVFNLDSKDEVIKCLEADPAVRAGRLSYEIYEWFGISGFALGE